MNTKEIIKCMELESETLIKIRDVALEKQKALISSDINGIQNFTHLEEELLSNLRDLESSRMEMLKQVTNELNYIEENYHRIKLSNLLAGRIIKEDLDKIVSLERFLKNTILQLKEINQQNQLLIQNSLEFINEAIISLLGNKTKSIIDRKI
jgi:hypothetical protein